MTISYLIAVVPFEIVAFYKLIPPHVTNKAVNAEMTARDNFNQIISSSAASREVPFQQNVASRIPTKR